MGIAKFVTMVKEAVGIKEVDVAAQMFSGEPESLRFIKDKDGNYSKWLGVYSNSFRDDDLVPEILESGGHVEFVKGVDAGIYDYPELWIWHNPKWKIGKATFVAVDVVKPGVVFAIAGGDIDPECYGIAKAIAESEVEWRMSHTFITNERNTVDDSYRKWVTLEVTILPAGKEANPLTRFGLLSQSEEIMIDNDKREQIKEALGVSDSVVDNLEAQNANIAEIAEATNREFKEVTEGDAQDAGLIGGSNATEESEKAVVDSAEDAEQVGAVIDNVEPVQEDASEEPVGEEPAPIVADENVFAQFVDMFKMMDERLDSLEEKIDEAKALSERIAAEAKEKQAAEAKAMSPIASYEGFSSLMSKYSARVAQNELKEESEEDAALLKQAPVESESASDINNGAASKFRSPLLSRYIKANQQ